jgi:hypothetical protein
MDNRAASAEEKKAAEIKQIINPIIS